MLGQRISGMMGSGVSHVGQAVSITDPANAAIITVSAVTGWQLYHKIRGKKEMGIGDYALGASLSYIGYLFVRGVIKY